MSDETPVHRVAATQAPRTWDHMPEELAGPFKVLFWHVLTLHFRWSMFKQLYVSGQRTVDLLNETASNFFAHLSDIWRDEIVLAAARLMDSRGDTLTLRHLVTIAVKYKARAIEPELAAKLSALDALMTPLEEHRNKRIAHLARHLDPRNPGVPGVLPPLEVELIESVLDGISDVMREIEAQFGDASTAFGAVSSPSDAEDLIVALKKAVIWTDMFPDPIERAMRLAEGRYSDL